MSPKSPARSPEVQTREWTALGESLEAYYGGADRDETKVFLAVEAVLACESTPEERQQLIAKIHDLLFDVGTKVWPIANERTDALKKFPERLIFGKELVKEALHRKWLREGFPRALTAEAVNDNQVTDETEALKDKLARVTG